LACRLFLFLAAQELQATLFNSVRHVNDGAIGQARSFYLRVAALHQNLLDCLGRLLAYLDKSL
jgi:hypothetical protein